MFKNGQAYFKYVRPFFNIINEGANGKYVYL